MITKCNLGSWVWILKQKKKLSEEMLVKSTAVTVS